MILFDFIKLVLLNKEKKGDVSHILELINAIQLYRIFISLL